MLVDNVSQARELLEEGLIDEAEFEDKRQQLLGAAEAADRVNGAGDVVAVNADNADAGADDNADAVMTTVPPRVSTEQCNDHDGGGGEADGDEGDMAERAAAAAAHAACEAARRALHSRGIGLTSLFPSEARHRTASSHIATIPRNAGEATTAPPPSLNHLPSILTPPSHHRCPPG